VQPAHCLDIIETPAWCLRQCYVSQALLLPEERKVFCRYVASVCSVRTRRVCAIAHRPVVNIFRAALLRGARCSVGIVLASRRTRVPPLQRRQVCLLWCMSCACASLTARYVNHIFAALCGASMQYWYRALLPRTRSDLWLQRGVRGGAGVRPCIAAVHSPPACC
jgi:hypothetical protein